MYFINNIYIYRELENNRMIEFPTVLKTLPNLYWM